MKWYVYRRLVLLQAAYDHSDGNKKTVMVDSVMAGNGFIKSGDILVGRDGNIWIDIITVSIVKNWLKDYI